MIAYHTVALTLTTILAISSAYPLAALSALLGGNGLSGTLNSNFNNFEGNPSGQQPNVLQQQEQQQLYKVQPANSCPCSQPRTEIFVTETPRGSEIIAAETTNGNGVSLATINDEYTEQEPEGKSHESIGDRSLQPSTLPARAPVSLITTDQPSPPVYPSHSYAGSLSGALSGLGHMGHAMSASGSLAGNLGYSGSMSGAGIGSGHGLGHTSSMAGSMAGPHGSLAGSLAGSHGMNSGSMAGSMAGSHHVGSMSGSHQIGSMSGSMAGSNYIGGETVAGSIARSNQNSAEGYVDRNVAGRETPYARKRINENDGDRGRNEKGAKRVDEKFSGVIDGSDSAGALAGGIGRRESHEVLAGSLAGSTHQNGGSSMAGSLASATDSRQVHAGSMAGVQGTGSQTGVGSSAMSRSLAGSHNGMAHAVSNAIAGYHRQNDNNALPLKQTEESQQPDGNRRSFNSNQNVNRNINYNSNSMHG